jgi:hypothetical protein
VKGRINILSGLGDLALDTFHDNKRLLIACAARRSGEAIRDEIISHDIITEKSIVLARLNEPFGFRFVPHGIDLVMDSAGRLMLYAVNTSLLQRKKYIQ